MIFIFLGLLFINLLIYIIGFGIFFKYDLVNDTFYGVIIVGIGFLLSFAIAYFYGTSKSKSKGSICDGGCYIPSNSDCKDGMDCDGDCSPDCSPDCSCG